MARTISRGRGGFSRALDSLALPMLLLVGGILTACNHDAPTALKAVEIPRPLVVEIAAPATSAYDDGINPYDTHIEQVQTVAETTTVTASEPFDDPNTGQPTYSTTVGSDPHSVNVNAGYGYDGQPRITTGFQQSSSEETVWLRRVTDETTDRRADGSDTQPFAYDPMAEVGTLQGAYMTAGGGGAGDPGCTQITGCAALRSEVGGVTEPTTTEVPTPDAVAGARRHVSQLSQHHVRVEDHLSSTAGLLTLHTASSQGEVARTEHKVTRDYEKQDGHWILKHTMHETFVETSERRVRLAMHLTVVASKVFRNKEKDAERIRGLREQGAAVAASLSVVSRSRANDVCDPATAIVPCSTETSSGAVTDPPHVNPLATTATNSWSSLGGTGPALVLQHGFMSAGGTWARMESWLRRDVSVAGIYRPSTPWGATYENQAGALHQGVAAVVGGAPTILIGHSNGGMVSRYLGRHPDAWNVYPQANVTGVISVGTPHYGAPLARAARNVRRLFGAGGVSALLLCSWSHTAGCDSWSHVSMSDVPAFFEALTLNLPVLTEMQPTDGYHQQFNGEYEGFRRFGVASNMWTRWMGWRLYGDIYCYPEAKCGGASQVRKTDRIYKRDIGCAIMGMFFSRIDAAIRCTADAVFLRGVDELFRRWVGYGGDGVVPGWSQKYPFIPDQDNYQVTGKDAPSHLGETESSRVGNRIETILVGKLSVRGTVGLAP